MISIWVYVWGPWNGKCRHISLPFSTFDGLKKWTIGSFCVQLVYFSHFGMLYREKSPKNSDHIIGQWLLITRLHGWPPAKTCIGSLKRRRTYCLHCRLCTTLSPTHWWGVGSGWPVLANFCLLGECLVWAISWKLQLLYKFLGYFFTVKILYYFWQKLGCATFWSIFHKLICSPWVGWKGRPSIPHEKGSGWPNNFVK
jgi:hypothetical protein